MLKMSNLRVLNSKLKTPARTLSTTREKIFDLSIDNEGIAVMRSQRRPVNSYSLDYLQSMKDSLDRLTKNEKYKGLIITSAIPKIFSAGLDLTELNKPDPERLKTFWRTLQDLFIRLYGSEATTTVAINGHAAAGACVVSLMCDYRVMVNDKFRIGMNDTAVGIVPAWWVREIMIRAMGYRQAEIAATSSRMYTAEEALKAQMIDELATDQEDAIEKCKKFIRLYDNIPRNIHSEAKRQLREPVIRSVKENPEKGVQTFVDNILNPYVQEQIGKYVEQLKQKKGK